MPLDIQTPNLDNRTYDDIVRQARLRIPRYTPDWTDMNDSDPGMTLVQLFAWLTEGLLYQMNQVPQRTYLKFLQVLGLDLDPAQPARAQLVFTPTPGTAVDPVPPGTPLGADPAGGGDQLIFETIEGLGLIRLPLTDVQIYDAGSFTTVTSANSTPGTTFRPFGWTPQVGTALYLGFDPGAQPAPPPIFPQVMRWRVWMPRSADPANGAFLSASQLEQSPAPTPPVQLVWEYRPQNATNRWRRLEVFRDDSAAFTREGTIQVQGPSVPAATPEGRVPKPRYWLRVRVESGAYPAGAAPLIDFLRPNVVEAHNQSTVRGENLGFSLGTPNQTFRLAHRPIIAGTLQLQVLDETDRDPTAPWTQVDDFLGSGPDDKHYLLNAAAGVITLGDGKNGRVPPAGSAATALTYAWGGGAAGNVDPGAISTLLTSLTGVESVTNPRQAAGGRDEEDLAKFILRAPSVLRHRNQAISAKDMTDIASQVGGIARAAALPLFHPEYPGVKVPGAVTILVIPRSQDRPPRPSQQELEAVCEQLEPHRLLTTELYVQGPAYREVRVEAQVQANPYAAFDQVRAQIIAAIDKELDPMTRDFGADLYATSLYRVILEVPEVKAVTSLGITIDGEPWDNLDCAFILNDNEMLFSSADHDISVAPYNEQSFR